MSCIYNRMQEVSAYVHVHVNVYGVHVHVNVYMYVHVHVNVYGVHVHVFLQVTTEHYW